MRTNLTVYDQLITKRSKQTHIQIYLTKQKGPKTSKTGLSTDLISKSFLHLRGLIEVYINTDHSPILIQKNVKTADYRTIPYICNLSFISTGRKVIYRRSPFLESMHTSYLLIVRPCPQGGRRWGSDRLQNPYPCVVCFHSKGMKCQNVTGYDPVA